MDIIDKHNFSGGFQFHIGSIKSPYLERAVQVLQFSFNSTLVRLKVFLLSVWYIWSVQFQFHIGSIKSRKADHDVLEVQVVSIPHWFD